MEEDGDKEAQWAGLGASGQGVNLGVSVLQRARARRSDVGQIHCKKLALTCRGKTAAGVALRVLWPEPSDGPACRTSRLGGNNPRDSLEGAQTHG